MDKGGYIHISEAVNVYDKTRQTFYNYVKKGLVESKKIHNKLYLKIEDIDKLLGNYLTEKEAEYMYDDENDVYTYTGNQSEENGSLLEKVHDLEDHIDSLKETINGKIELLERKSETLPESIKREISIDTTNAYRSINTSIESITSQIVEKEEDQRITKKKIYFALGYIAFILINASILLFLSL